jgi:hypothetical protein
MIDPPPRDAQLGTARRRSLSCYAWRGHGAQRDLEPDPGRGLLRQRRFAQP